jgi:hypothetical protein
MSYGRIFRIAAISLSAACVALGDFRVTPRRYRKFSPPTNGPFLHKQEQSPKLMVPGAGLEPG